MPWKILREAAPSIERRRPAIDGASTSRACSGRWTSLTAATSNGSGQAPRIRCRRTTGCGGRKGRSICTCPSVGAMSNSRTFQPASERKPSSKIRMNASLGAAAPLHRQRRFRDANGRYAATLDALMPPTSAWTAPTSAPCSRPRRRSTRSQQRDSKGPSHTSHRTAGSG